MLQLTDQALARLVIAATAVAPDERAAWLEQLARKIDPPRSRSSNAARVARHRAREAKGERCYRLVIPDKTMEHVLDALVGYGQLTEAQTMDPAVVEAALVDIIAAFAAGWRGRNFR